MAPRITPEENARISRREKAVSRTIIAVIVASVLGMMLWNITDTSEPDPSEQPSLSTCRASVPPCLENGMVRLAVPNALGDDLMTIDEYRQFRQEARELGYP
jgi:hypothetical protein